GGASFPRQTDLPRWESSERVDGLGQRGLAVGSLVGVDDTLRDGLVELARSGLQRGGRGLLVARGDGLAHLAHVGLQLRLDGLVAKAGLLVRLVALDLGLDVCHVWTSWCVRLPASG